MSIQGISQLGEMPETQGLGLLKPGVQEGGCKLFIGQTPKGAQILFEQVSGVERFIDLHEHHEPCKRTGRETLQCPEQEEPAPLDELFILAAELTGHISSGLIDSPVDNGHHMVRIMDNVHIGEHLTNRLHVGGRHIHGHRCDLGLLALELLKERDERIGIFAFMDMEDLTSFKIEYYGHVVINRLKIM